MKGLNEMLVTVNLTEEEQQIAEWYASNRSITLEEAFKQSLFEKIRKEKGDIAETAENRTY